MGVFDTLNKTSSASPAPSSGGVFSKINQVEQVQHAAQFKQNESNFGAPNINPSFPTGQQIMQNPVPIPPTLLQKIEDNPVVHGVEKGVQAVGEVFDKISHLPVINQVTGGMQGMVEPFVHSDAAASKEPLWEKYLGNVKDAVNLTHNLLNPTSFITGNLVPSSNDKTIIDKTKAAIQSPQSLVKGILNPDQARQDLTNSLKSRSTVMNLATESLADPLSYVPFPSIGGIKGLSTTLKDSLTGTKLGGAVDKFLSKSKSVLPETEQVAQKTLSNYSKPLTNPQPLDSVMQDIHQEVSQRITPPLENPKLLDKYLSLHLGEDVPKSEISTLSFNDKAELAKHIQDNLSVHDVATQVAKEKGYDWNQLIGQSKPIEAPTNVFAKLNQQTAFKIGDEAIPTSAGGADLSEAKKIIDVQSKDGINYYRFEGEKTYMPENMVRKSESIPLQQNEKIVQPAIPRTVNVQPDVRVKGQQLKDIKTGDEVKFAQTVKDSENTLQNLSGALKDNPVVGARTTDVLNRQQANDMITRHGEEGLYSKLMAKNKQFSASETTAAQILAKKFSSVGGKENLSKAIDLVSKTAQGGREMGQAIQALSQWDKLDQAGALLLGERQLNKGVTDIRDWKSLTTEQAAPIQEAAQKAESAVQTKSLADEVLHIVTNKAEGEKLTEAEKATIKQFNDQVKNIQDKTKSFLPKEKVVSKSDETIKEVSQIEPKARTRDQVVSFLDAKAAKAKARLDASRNKISSNPADFYVNHAIIGAAKIAKGVVKLSDFTEQMVKEFGTVIKPHINDIFTQATNIFRKENGLPTVEALDRVVNKAVKDERFTAEDAASFKAWAAEIGHYADHNLKVEATQDLQAAMKDLGDSTLGQKIATVQTGAMLLNPVTIERNVLGNAVDYIGDKVSKVATVPIDWSLSKLTGSERTIVFNSMNQEKFWKNYMIGTKSGWKGVSPNGQLDSYGVNPNIFGKNNPLKYITKSLGASLQGFDHAFYSLAKGDVLATYAEQLGKAQGLSHAEIKSGMKDLIVQLDDRIHEMADHAGRYATYQDETLLSKGAEMLRKGLNEASTGALSRSLVEKGMPKKYSLEGFGAGDVLVKFAKTPANLVMRGLDYSPVGFIRSIMDLGTFVFKREKFNQHEAVRSLGRAITGTLGFTGMGYVLADAGILTGSASMDKDVRSIQEQSGQGAYKVNWSALGRFLRSGFSYDAAAYQKGDHLMDYQWLQPAAISVAMGVNANKAVKAHQAGDQTAGWQMAGKALLGGLQTVLENPMVQGLSSVIDAGTDIIKKQDPTKLINIAKGIPASFVPTLLNQARKSTDNYQRETFDKSVLTEIGNMMANKVPGLSSKLPISYDSLGNAREELQGGKANTIGQYLNSFFSPAKLTQYQVSPEAKMTLDLMNQSGDATVLPNIVNKYFHVGQGKQLKDLKVNLNKEQFSQLQEETGRMVTEKLHQQADYLANPNVALQHKVDKVKQILSDVGKKAKQDIGQQMGYKKSKVKS